MKRYVCNVTFVLLLVAALCAGLLAAMPNEGKPKEGFAVVGSAQVQCWNEPEPVEPSPSHTCPPKP